MTVAKGTVIFSSTKMAPVGSSLCSPTTYFLLSPSMQRVSRKMNGNRHGIKFRVSNVMAESAAGTTERTSFGFKNLTETFWVDVHRAQGRQLNLSLNSPLSLGSTSFEKMDNVAIRVELSNGCVGWGEVPVLPLVAGNQANALEKVRETCQFLNQSQPMTLNFILDAIGAILPGGEFASVSKMKMQFANFELIDVSLFCI